MRPGVPRRRQQFARTPEALAARLPDDLRSLAGLYTPSDYQALRRNVADWLNQAAPGHGPKLAGPVMTAADLPLPITTEGLSLGEVPKLRGLRDAPAWKPLTICDDAPPQRRRRDAYDIRDQCVSGHTQCVNMDTMAVGEFVEYTRPPVRNTVLRVYFEPIENFDIGLALALNSAWGDEYPVLRQATAKPRPATPSIPDVDPPFSNGDWWAMSSIEQTDESLQKALSYQFDQIALSWSFDADKPEGQYPRFEKLSAELNARLTDLTRVFEQSDSDFVVQACECIYTNILEDVRGPDWVTGYLTGWNDSAVLAETPTDRAFIGFNTRNISIHETSETVAYVRLRDHLKSQEAELTIRVVATPVEGELEDLKGVDKARELMKVAHRELISNFERCGNPKMKDGWGKVKR